jgi:gas vesicle protein
MTQATAFLIGMVIGAVICFAIVITGDERHP